VSTILIRAKDLILRSLDEGTLQDKSEIQLFGFSELKHIRESFFNDEEPYPDFCSRCVFKGFGVAQSVASSAMNILHIEPS